MEKMTKREKFGMLLEVLEGSQVEQKEMLVEFVQHELELLAKKSGSKKAPKKDELKDAVAMMLCAEDAVTGADVLAEVKEMFPDATQAKVTARLTALVKEGYATKAEAKFDKRTLMTYKLA